MRVEIARLDVELERAQAAQATMGNKLASDYKTADHIDRRFDKFEARLDTALATINTMSGEIRSFLRGHGHGDSRG